MSQNTYQEPENAVSFPAEDDDIFALSEMDMGVAEFIGDVGRAYQDAFLQRKLDCKLTQRQLAQKLDVDRSHIHRCLSGHNNLTLETMAKLALALKAKPIFHLDLEPLDDQERANFHITAPAVYPGSLSPPGVIIIQSTTTPTGHAFRSSTVGTSLGTSPATNSSRMVVLNENP